MLLRDLERSAQQQQEADLSALSRLGKTLALQRKYDAGLRLFSRWLAMCDRPALSCGGGKDSNILLLMAMDLGVDLPVYRADPPNPLPDRPAFVEALQQATPFEWRIIPYPWDVIAVLHGRERYPEMLKVRRLKESYLRDGIDGIALGLRAEESRARTRLALYTGPIYKAHGVLVCCPLLDWTAEEVVAFQLAADLIPLNPVYRKLALAPPLNRLRDGTWYPREIADGRGYRAWLQKHYPELIESYDLALRQMNLRRGGG